MERPLLATTKLPFVIFETGPKQKHAWDLVLCTTPTDAVSVVEPPDIRDDMYMIFDAEGRLLKYTVDEKDKVHLHCTEQEPTHREKLTYLLRYMLSKDKGNLDYEGLDVPQLLDMAKDGYSYVDLPPLRVILWRWIKRLFGVTPK